jgi:O-antigen/teichoic acid export membrane protein
MGEPVIAADPSAPAVASTDRTLGERLRPARAEDVTGRSRFATNVLSSWAGHVVLIASGFILPRFINDHLGQVTLGVWDFCWSMVQFFDLAQVGVGASINRDVARYRAEGDFISLRRTVSSAVAVQWVASILALVLTVIGVALLPLLSSRLGGHVDTARWVLSVLGCTVAVELAFNSYRGVVAGCHRWELQNGITAAAQLIIVPVMVLTLIRGGGLTALAVVTLVSTALRELVRARVAHRLCPQIAIGPRYASWGEVRRLLVFGSKVSALSLINLVVYQFNILMIVTGAGVGALAIYARPMALVRQIGTFGQKFSMVLTPTAGALDDGRSRAALRDLAVSSTRNAAYLLGPPLIFVGVMGDAVLRLWMGPRFDQSLAAALLAFGHLYPMALYPAVGILVGMDRHGPLVWISAVAGLVACAASSIAVGVFDWGVAGAAGALVVSSTLGAVAAAVFVTRVIETDVWTFHRRALGQPAVVGLLLIATLLGVRLVTPDHAAVRLIAAMLAGGIVLAPVYWTRVLPPRIRERIRRMLGARRSPASPGGEGRS